MYNTPYAYSCAVTPSTGDTHDNGTTPPIQRPPKQILGLTHLLDVGGEPKQRLGVRQQSPRSVAKEGGVPHSQEAHQHRDVLARGLVEEVVVHVVRPVQETPRDFEAVVEGDREHAYGRAHAVPERYVQWCRKARSVVPTHRNTQA